MLVGLLQAQRSPNQQKRICREWVESESKSQKERKRQLKVRLVVVKRFPENTYFPEMLISGKGKCFPLFGCLGNRFPENQFRCLVRPNILRKSFYGKSIPVFDSSKNFTENSLRKIISSVWFMDQFYRKYEMCYKLKHLYYLHNPVNKVQN